VARPEQTLLACLPQPGREDVQGRMLRRNLLFTVYSREQGRNRWTPQCFLHAFPYTVPPPEAVITAPNPQGGQLAYTSYGQSLLQTATSHPSEMYNGGGHLAISSGSTPPPRYARWETPGSITAAAISRIGTQHQDTKTPSMT